MSCHVVEYVVNECFWKRTHCKEKFQNPSCPNYLFSSINNMMTIPIVADNLSCGLGAEFVVPFFSLALVLSLSSRHQKVIKWHPFSFKMRIEKLCHLSENFNIWNKKVVIWWLFDVNLWAREQEPEEKETTNSMP